MTPCYLEKWTFSSMAFVCPFKDNTANCITKQVTVVSSGAGLKTVCSRAEFLTPSRFFHRQESLWEMQGRLGM